MHIDVNHYHHFPEWGVPLDKILLKLEQKMSALSDQIAVLTTSVDAAIMRSTTVVNDLDAKITALQAQVDAGNASPADVAALTALQQKLDALDPTSPVVIPPSP